MVRTENNFKNESSEEFKYKKYLINDYITIGNYVKALSIAEELELEKINFRDVKTRKDLVKKSIKQSLNEKKINSTINLLTNYFSKDKNEEKFYFIYQANNIGELILQEYERISNIYLNFYHSEPEFKSRPIRKQLTFLETQIKRLTKTNHQNKDPILNRIKEKFNIITLETKIATWFQDYTLLKESYESFNNIDLKIPEDDWIDLFEEEFEKDLNLFI